MPFQVSPGVNVSEIDLSTVVPAVSTTEGALVGVFQRGPVNQRILITSEANLVARFGKPTADNYETWFTAANFLAYGNKLYVTRVVSDATMNAGDQGNAGFIETRSDAEAITVTTTFVAQDTGAIGNQLMVSVCYDSADFSESITLNSGLQVGNTTVVVANTQVENTELQVNDILRVGNSSVGFQDLTVTAVTATNSEIYTLSFTPAYNLADTSPTSATRYWRYYNNVDGAPGAANSHIVVVDENGGISGIANTILEVYADVSRTSSAKDDEGNNIYYRDVINESSNYIWATGVALSDTADNYLSLSGGWNGVTETNVPIGKLARGADLYKSAENVDISLFLTGKSGDTPTYANYLIDNIAETRKDCVVFVSPARGDVVEQSFGAELDQVLTFEGYLTQSSYAFLDSGYKYQYDKYNDVYRYVPLNGDIAGLCVRTDELRDAWWSPAGYNRGIIKNVVKLAWNPDKGNRDQLYKAGVNPVITQPGQGTLLFGDKTLLARPSAFDRINVRRLFIVLEKAIATASKFTLFEFNDAFTRAQFRNLVEPFLRDVQGRRGIYDFRVVCDETNNTGEVIDRNEFVGDIYIKPAKSINFIQLNFVAVRTGVEFEEIVGKF